MPATPPFAPEEYDRRLALTRAAMAQAGLDWLLVTDPSNMAWLTGYDGWSFYVHQGVILGQSGAPVWWGRGQDANGARRTVWMSHDHILGYADTLVQSRTVHPMQDLALRFRAFGAGQARIGVEMENYYYSARAHAVLEHELPQAELCDATALVNWCRLIKSAPELDYMRRAARISERIVTLAVDLARPGLRKNDLVAEILRAGVQGVGDDWGDYPAIVPLTPSGVDASAPHLTWDGREMQLGAATFLELSGCYRRYHAPLCRTVHLGPAPAYMRRASEALSAGLEAGLEAARPGRTAGDVARALAAELARAGITRSARCGYPVGLSYPPDWGERTVSFRESDETVLRPGMTFHFMPGLWMEDWGMETTETILIRETGPAEPLANLPRQLFEKV